MYYFFCLRKFNWTIDDRDGKSLHLLLNWKSSLYLLDNCDSARPHFVMMTELPSLSLRDVDADTLYLILWWWQRNSLVASWYWQKYPLPHFVSFDRDTCPHIVMLTETPSSSSFRDDRHTLVLTSWCWQEYPPPHFIMTEQKYPCPNFVMTKIPSSSLRDIERKTLVLNLWLW